MKSIENKKTHLMTLVEIGKSGFGGVLGNGQIVDRRVHPEALPMQENKLMGIPKPIPVDDNGGCPPDCGHTPEEHHAFDCGVADGRRGGIEVENPYDPAQSPDEWDAWETGKSVGAQEHNSANTGIECTDTTVTCKNA